MIQISVVVSSSYPDCCYPGISTAIVWSKSIKVEFPESQPEVEGY